MHTSLLLLSLTIVGLITNTTAERVCNSNVGCQDSYIADAGFGCAEGYDDTEYLGFLGSNNRPSIRCTKDCPDHEEKECDAQLCTEYTQRCRGSPGSAQMCRPALRFCGGHIRMDESICTAQDMEHPVKYDQGSGTCSWDSKPLNETQLLRRVLETPAEQDGSVHTMVVTCNGLSARGFRDLEEDIETPPGTDNWNIGSNVFTPWLTACLYACDVKQDAMDTFVENTKHKCHKARSELSTGAIFTAELRPGNIEEQGYSGVCFDRLGE